jgi:hypothetical protein
MHFMQVNSAWNNGDVSGAQRNSQSARRWGTTSIVIGITAAVSYVLVMIIIPIVTFAAFQNS